MASRLCKVVEIPMAWLCECCKISFRRFLGAKYFRVSAHVLSSSISVISPPVSGLNRSLYFLVLLKNHWINTGRIVEKVDNSYCHSPVTSCFWSFVRTGVDYRSMSIWPSKLCFDACFCICCERLTNENKVCVIPNMKNSFPTFVGVKFRSDCMDSSTAHHMSNSVDTFRPFRFAGVLLMFIYSTEFKFLPITCSDLLTGRGSELLKVSRGCQETCPFVSFSAMVSGYDAYDLSVIW